MNRKELILQRIGELKKLQKSIEKKLPGSDILFQAEMLLQIAKIESLIVKNRMLFNYLIEFDVYNQ